MKFVALVSGGKDSMFNILHCVANGHELVAMANLHPPVTASDELDSFMYQTVGYHAVSLYDQCLGVPMYRTEIIGSSVVKSLEYSPEIDDETEDLFRLLRIVSKTHNVEAVSVGAILSTYQRTRVENVCQRLGLTCLSYLWNRSQAELLDEIIDSGVDARIVKTAGIGLSKAHLGKSLKELRNELVQLNRDFGLHLCGEGGEYETLVLDAPNMRKKLVLDVGASKIVEDSDECVSYLSDLAIYPDDKQDTDPNRSPVRIPPNLDDKHQELYDDLLSVELGPDEEDAGVSTSTIPEMQISANADRLFVANITSPADTIEQETRAVFGILKKELENEGLTFDNCLSISLLVADMAEFHNINAIYGEYFTKPNPPSRLCIQTDLRCRLQLSALATKTLETRRGLHVQGRSYWAPANIGPYAQSIQSEEVTTLAGQIGLVPSTLQLEPDLYKQTVLSLQHAHRILEAVGSEKFASTVAYITSSKTVPVVAAAWESGPLLIAKIKALPKGAQVEWTGQAINDTFIKGIPDYDENENEEDDVWTYPPKFKANQAIEYGRYGTVTLTGTAQHLDTQISALTNVFTTTLYTTHLEDVSFDCEVVYVDALYDKRGEKVPMGAVVTYRL